MPGKEDQADGVRRPLPSGGRRCGGQGGCKHVGLAAQAGCAVGAPGLLVEVSRLVPLGNLGSDDLGDLVLGENAPGHLGRTQPLDAAGEMPVCAGRR